MRCPASVASCHKDGSNNSSDQNSETKLGLARNLKHEAVQLYTPLTFQHAPVANELLRYQLQLGLPKIQHVRLSLAVREGEPVGSVPFTIQVRIRDSVIKHVPKVSTAPVAYDF